MAQTAKTIDFAAFTKLPVEHHFHPNRSGGVVRVQTPHKGEVLLDLQYNGMLNVYDELTSTTIEKMRRLEDEAREHLLQEWLTTNQPI